MIKPHGSSLKSGWYRAAELSMLCHQLAVYFKSGMNPLEVIPLVNEDIENSDMKSTLLDISNRILEGLPLSKALSRSRRFPDYLVRMVAIGENTGMLETVMESLSVYYETEADIQKSIKSAVTYPAVLALMMLGVIALLILKVIPMFGEILQSLGGQIPTEAQILFTLAQSMKSVFLWLLGILFGGILLFFTAIRTPRGRRFFDGIKVKNPFSGLIYKKITASRLSQGLSLTLQSGMNVTTGFQFIMGLVDNTYVNERLTAAYIAISQGQSFSEAVKESKLFPAMFIRMVRTGERSGRLDQMMKKLSGVYAREAELSLKKISGSIEPVMVTLLSVILGIVLLSVLLPLISIMSSIG